MNDLKELKALKSKSEQEWIESIERLDPAIKNPVAKLVWWDFFAGRMGNDRAHGFSRYLEFDGNDYPNNQLADGLVGVGYPRHYARLRVEGRGLSRSKEY